MRIAQVSTIWETTPPRLYGGTERVVAHLTEELMARGHDVTLFATGDSTTTARLSSIIHRPLYRQGIPWNNFLYPLEHVAQVFERAAEFDLIHVHLNKNSDFPALALASFVTTPTIFTLHFALPVRGTKSTRDRYNFLHRYREARFITISQAQRTLRFLHYRGTVHNGLNFPVFKKPKANRSTLVWLGRICRDKGTKEAIEVARRTGMKLILAGKIDVFSTIDQHYFRKFIKPFIDGRQIRHVGEVTDVQKRHLFREAYALLHPIRWQEPFGLVVIEAMAAGVPVLAFDRGPVREQIIPDKTGFIVRNVPEMVKKIPHLADLDPVAIRQHVDKNFTAAVMAERYEAVYRRFIH